jgi:hypothetical protein
MPEKPMLPTSGTKEVAVMVEVVNQVSVVAVVELVVSVEVTVEVEVVMLELFNCSIWKKS